jgi:hypothetical protein
MLIVDTARTKNVAQQLGRPHGRKVTSPEIAAKRGRWHTDDSRDLPDRQTRAFTNSGQFAAEILTGADLSPDLSRS